jgi:hypothetical protein
MCRQASACPEQLTHALSIAAALRRPSVSADTDECSIITGASHIGGWSPAWEVPPDCGGAAHLHAQGLDVLIWRKRPAQPGECGAPTRGGPPTPPWTCRRVTGRFSPGQFTLAVAGDKGGGDKDGQAFDAADSRRKPWVDCLSWTRH